MSTAMVVAATERLLETVVCDYFDPAVQARVVPAKHRLLGAMRACGMAAMFPDILRTFRRSAAARVVQLLQDFSGKVSSSKGERVVEFCRDFQRVVKLIHTFSTFMGACKVVSEAIVEVGMHESNLIQSELEKCLPVAISDSEEIMFFVRSWVETAPVQGFVSLDVLQSFAVLAFKVDPNLVHLNYGLFRKFVPEVIKSNGFSQDFHETNELLHALQAQNGNSRPFYKNLRKRTISEVIDPQDHQ